MTFIQKTNKWKRVFILNKNSKFHFYDEQVFFSILFLHIFEIYVLYYVKIYVEWRILLIYFITQQQQRLIFVSFLRCINRQQFRNM